MIDRDVMVLGGSGFLGRRVVRRLVERGHAVTVGSRCPEKRAQQRDAGAPAVRHVLIDLRRRQTLVDAFEGTDAVVNCMGLYVESGAASFRDVHVHGARDVAEVAGMCGLRKCIHVSGIGIDPNSRSSYVRARAEGEDAVRLAFPPADILRPSAMFSSDGAFFGVLDTMVRRLPVVPMFGSGTTRLQPVHVEDVAEAIARVIEGPATGTVYELGGPDIFTYREILERLALRAGVRRAFLPVPFAAWRLLALMARPLPRPPLTLGQVVLMERDNVVGNGVATFGDLWLSPRSAAEMGLL